MDVCQIFNSWHWVTLHKFKAGSSSSWNKWNLFWKTQTIYQINRISTSNHWSGTLFCPGYNTSQKFRTSFSEFWNLKHTNWAVPENWFWSFNVFIENPNRLWSNIEGLPSIRNSFNKIESSCFNSSFHLFSCHTVKWEMNSTFFETSFIKNFMKELLILWQLHFCASKVEAKYLLKERMNHSSSNNNLIGNINHVTDQL